jgi:hypothetical protein
MVRAMFTGGWYARLDAAARFFRRRWRNLGSLMPRGGHGLRRWREVLLGVHRSLGRSSYLNVVSQRARWRQARWGAAGAFEKLRGGVAWVVFVACVKAR